MSSIPTEVESNSYKSKQMTEVPSVVTKPPVCQRHRKTLIDLILPDDVSSVQDYIATKSEDVFKTVIWPGIKGMIVNAVSSYLNSIPMGGAQSSGLGAGIVSRTDYGAASRKAAPAIGREQRITHDDIVFYASKYGSMDAARKEAENLLAEIEGLYTRQGGYISLLQIYSLAGCGAYTVPGHNEYGYTSFANFSSPKNGGDRYIVALPRPEYIGNN